MSDNLPKSRQDRVWKSEHLSQTFLTGVRGAIPLAAEQIDLILRLIALSQSEVKNFLDLGCGNGILGRAIHDRYPESRGLFLDFSEPMLDAAKKNIDDNSGQLKFILQDFGSPEWSNIVSKEAPFDVIVSGFAIHHQTDERKKTIYQEIYNLLSSGGLFLNLEHIASRSKLGANAFNELFIDSLYSFHHQQGSQQSREEIKNDYYNRPDKEANILSFVELQCDWLREIGFVEVDCFMKLLEIALFGGRKP